MNNEYIIVNKTTLQKRIEELEKVNEVFKNVKTHNPTMAACEATLSTLKQILSQSTPLIPEIEKAMDVAREIKDDSAHDTFTAEDISGCTEVCTYGWRYKTTNENYISNFKLDI
jgi:hypothetical protein